MQTVTDKQLALINSLVREWLDISSWGGSLEGIRHVLGDLFTECGLLHIAEYICWDKDRNGHSYPPSGWLLLNELRHNSDFLWTEDKLKELDGHCLYQLTRK